MTINYKELEQELRKMTPRSILFGLVRDEMKRRGHWKYLKRGWHISGKHVGPPK